MPLTFQQRIIAYCSEDELADLLGFLEQVRTLRKLGGYGEITAKMENGILKRFVRASKKEVI